MIRKLCVLSSYYPQINDPVYSFVGTLIEKMADMGVECHVISPVSYIERKHKAKSRIEKTEKGSIIHVYCPRYIIFPSRNILGFKTYRFTVGSLRNAIYRVFKHKVGCCDAIYSHFIDAGVNAAWLKKKTGIPAFMAVGESTIKRNELAYSIFRDDLYNGLNGVICVSTQLKNDLKELDIINENIPVLVAPNGIDTEIFKPGDKEKARRELGAGKNDFIVSFVGAYIKRKGFDKLLEVLSKQQSWKCILIGDGDIDLELNIDQVLFYGRIPHDQIPDYINASDVFVLPTLAEGCCNAIIEALGCGLPVVSSNRSFNDDILDDTCSIRINPESVQEIESALLKLYSNEELRTKLANGAYINGSRLSITKRAKNILNFIDVHLDNQEKIL